MTKPSWTFCSLVFIYFVTFALQTTVHAAKTHNPFAPPPLNREKLREEIKNDGYGPYFDLPVTYNAKVKKWISFFQNTGKKDFTRWLERSHRYLPYILPVLEAQGLPRDLAYLAMIESGFSPRAVSTAAAVGYWQFIKPTAKRYGLQVDWWIDERRDIAKSTIAAANYLNDLYKMFDSWYLAASAYNMGEGRVKSLIKKYKTKNYWSLSRKKDFPSETEQYIPKLIAAMLIAKSPKLYGFREITPLAPYEYVYFQARGGTDLTTLARLVGVDPTHLQQLNPELVKGFIPGFVKSHKIRIPRGTLAKATKYAQPRL